ncbi:MAG: Ppx/GppA family phosphatase [Ignavibacteria bacterium]|nr:Ppx/GppA family phosphatase [Ignavibacteria bacterium]
MAEYRELVQLKDILKPVRTILAAMSAKPTAPSLIASIDVGTNSFHMVIASVSARGVLEVHAKNKELVRLGASAGDMKKLSSEAMKRGVATLKIFAAEAEQHGAHVRAVATSAVREALNASDFIDEVRTATGIDVEVISGIEEGRLIYVGALHALPIVKSEVLVVDIGGGSTELVIGKNGSTQYVHSSKLGHIRMTKRFFTDAKVTDEQIEECRVAIRNEWLMEFQTLLQYGFETAIGTSGTISAIATMVLTKAGKRVPESLNGLRFSRSELLDVIADVLGARTQQKRLALPGMDAKRADVIVGGALILEQAIIGLNIQELTISGYALREGIVFDTVQKQRDIDEHHHLAHLRYQSIHQLSKRYEARQVHAEHVKKLALQLFDDLGSLHGMTDKEREILEAAALLHDIGFYVSAEQHHKHAEYIIRNSSVLGFTNDETDLIASVARYHRKSHPKKKHDLYGGMSAEEQQIVRLLSGLLRIAEGLDRRQHGYVQQVRAKKQNGGVTILLTAPTSQPDVELWSAERRKDLLEEALACDVKFQVQSL